MSQKQASPIQAMERALTRLMPPAKDGLLRRIPLAPAVESALQTEENVLNSR